MEKLKVKHDHSLTNIIKVGIFAIFLLLPLMIFLPSALYYGFNEHAKVPEETNVIYNYKYETNEVNNANDLIANNIYYLEEADFSTGNQDFQILQSYQGVEINVFKFNLISFSYDSADVEEIYIENFNSNNGNSLSFYILDENTIYLDFYLNDNFVSLNFDELEFYISDVYLNCNNLNALKDLYNVSNWHFQESDFNILESVTVETDETPTISTKMYHSWQDVWQQPIFNWTGNNNFTFTINTFSQVFGITEQSYIANYINYLMTLTTIYIVFDIILTIFVKLTHLFNE